MIFYDFSQGHNATRGLQSVHEQMMLQYNIKNDDAIVAQKMQKYLQYFKKIFSNPETYSANDELLDSLGLEQKAIEEMRTRFQEVLGVSNKYNQIFRSQHAWYANRKDFDDIVEGELNALLQVVAEKATGKKNVNLGQKIVGSENAFIDFEELEKGIVDGILDNVSKRLSNKKRSEILKTIKAEGRSGKIDVKGYNRELFVEAEINDNFKNFIDLFSNVNFSIKNYRGDTKYEIHLGESNPFKAMYGSLRDLGYDQQTATHIYSHAAASYKKNPQVASRNNDIYHLRFLYELTGAGLFTTVGDNKKEPLDKVDYLIYNDPTSDKIYVKSTKQMILELLKNKDKKVGNPWADIYISKLDFK